MHGINAYPTKQSGGKPRDIPPVSTARHGMSKAEMDQFLDDEVSGEAFDMRQVRPILVLNNSSMREFPGLTPHFRRHCITEI
jgi:hypothetical protein